MPGTRSALVAAVLLSWAAAEADGLDVGMRPEPPTRFERFLLADCTACVREVFPVSVLPTPALTLAGLGRQVASVATRPGEVRFEVIRAYPLGRPTQQFAALRVHLSLAAADGQLFQFASGLVDEPQVPVLASAVREMARLLEESPPAGGPETTEVEAREGSVRLGAFRVRDTAVGYVQAGDLRVLPLPGPGSAQGVLFLPAADLRALETALRQVTATLDRLRVR